MRTYYFDALWALLTLACVASVPLLFVHVWVLAIVPATLAILIGVIVALYRLFNGDRRRAAVLGGVLLLIVVGALPMQGYVSRARAHVRFALERDKFDATVARESRLPPREHREWSDSYIVEAGSPLRIAFPAPGRWLDNWCGVVFDPSALVMRANEFRPDWSNWDEPSLARVKALFGGDLRFCRHLDEAYYHCCFT